MTPVHDGGHGREERNGPCGKAKTVSQFNLVVVSFFPSFTDYFFKPQDFELYTSVLKCLACKVFL